MVHKLPETALDFGIPVLLNLIFVALVSLVLWPLGLTSLAISLAKGYLIFWIVTVVTALVVHWVQRFFRVDTDSRIDAFTISNLGHSLVLLTGWSAFAALAVRSHIAGAPGWTTTILWLVGVLSSIMAFVVVTTFYRGSVYRLINISTALAGFCVFAFWPASARATFGWFFNLF